MEPLNMGLNETEDITLFAHALDEAVSSHLI